MKNKHEKRGIGYDLIEQIEEIFTEAGNSVELEDLIESAVEERLEGSVEAEVPPLSEVHDMPIIGKRSLDLNVPVVGNGVSVEGAPTIEGTDAGGALSNGNSEGIPFLLVPVVLLVFFKNMFPGNGRVHARQFRQFAAESH